MKKLLTVLTIAGLLFPTACALAQAERGEDEEAVFESLPSRLRPTPVPPGFRGLAALGGPRVEPPPGPSVNPPPPSLDNPAWLQELERSIRLSGVSITRSEAIALISYQGRSLRLHPGDSLTGELIVKKVEPNRALLAHPQHPAFWIYRVRPGMTDATLAQASGIAAGR